MEDEVGKFKQILTSRPPKNQYAHEHSLINVYGAQVPSRNLVVARQGRRPLNFKYRRRCPIGWRQKRT